MFEKACVNLKLTRIDMNMDKLSESLSKTIFSEKNKELTIDISEAEIDKFLEEGVLKDMPIIRTIVGIYKTGANIRAWFMIKKIKKFLSSLSSISDEEKQSFLVKFDSNESYKNKIMERLLILIDRLDDEEKSKIVGSLFRAAIQDKISITEFQKLCNVIDNIYIDELKSFCIFNSRLITNEDKIVYSESSEYYRNSNSDKYLASLGLMREQIVTSDTMGKLSGNNQIEYSFKYDISKLGQQLIDHADISISKA